MSKAYPNNLTDAQYEFLSIDNRIPRTFIAVITLDAIQSRAQTLRPYRLYDLLTASHSSAYCYSSKNNKEFKCTMKFG
jgi:hypothetical protein